MHWSIWLLGSILIILGIALPGTSQEEIQQFADRLYCKIGGSCNITNLIVENLTVVGDYFNVSVTNFNVTGDMNISGCVNFPGGYYACGDTNHFGTTYTNYLNTSFIYSQYSRTAADIQADPWYFSTSLEVMAGSDFCIDGGVCLSTVDTQKKAQGPYLFNDTTTIYFNESMLNATIEALAGSGDTKWTPDNLYLQNVSDILTFNETLMNLTIDARASGGIWTNVSGTATYPSNVSISGNLSVHNVIALNHGWAIDVNAQRLRICQGC